MDSGDATSLLLDGEEGTDIGWLAAPRWLYTAAGWDLVAGSQLMTKKSPA